MKNLIQILTLKVVEQSGETFFLNHGGTTVLFGFNWLRTLMKIKQELGKGWKKELIQKKI